MTVVRFLLVHFLIVRLVFSTLFQSSPPTLSLLTTRAAVKRIRLGPDLKPNRLQDASGKEGKKDDKGDFGSAQTIVSAMQAENGLVCPLTPAYRLSSNFESVLSSPKCGHQYLQLQKMSRLPIKADPLRSRQQNCHLPPLALTDSLRREPSQARIDAASLWLGSSLRLDDR